MAHARHSGDLCAAAVVLMVMLLAAHPASVRATEPESDQVDVELLVEDLASKRFQKRQAAFLRLVQLADLAIDPLEQAAQSEQLEVATRSIHALTEIGREKESSEPAMAALQRLADDESSTISPLAAAAIKELKMTDADRAVEALNAAGARIHRDSRGNIYGVSVSRDREVALLRYLPSVTSVHLNGPDVSNACMKHLANVSGLMTLDLNQTAITDVGLRELENLSSIRHLMLSSKLFTDRGLSRLGDMSGLRMLSLTALNDGEELNFLNGLTQLQSLNLSNMRLSSSAPETINRLGNLRRVTLALNDADDRQLAQAGRIKAPLSLFLMRATGVTGEGWKQLQGTKLHRLTLMRTSIDDAALKSIAQVGSLQSISIYSADVTDEGLKHLGQLRQLRYLTLRETRVTAEGVARLREKLPGLRRVSVDTQAAKKQPAAQPPAKS